VQRVAESVGMSKGQLAETVGLSRKTFHKAARANAAKTQSRIREMLEIVSRVSAWAGGKDQAMAWYRAQPIAAFGDRTAEALVKSGQAAAVRDYLDHLALGGFARGFRGNATAHMIQDGRSNHFPAAERRSTVRASTRKECRRFI
jgi:Protein of unknown function (DUF2384)